ncbi:MAG: hypothetical protein ACI9JY_001324, partial [Saprospiraceae bacterium]
KPSICASYGSAQGIFLKFENLKIFSLLKY